MALGPGETSVLLPVATRTASGLSAPVAWDRAARGLLLRCAPDPAFTPADATLLVEVVLDAEKDEGPGYGVLAAFGYFHPGYTTPRDNTVERTVERSGPLPREDTLLVVRWTITGTSPAITFGVTGEGYQD